jgi:hypothetical protein
MAENQPPKDGFVDNTKNNEEVARKLENQGSQSTLPNPSDSKVASDALDKLAQEAEAKKQAADAPPADKKADPAPPADKKADPAPPAEPTPEQKAAAERAEQLKKADEFFKGTPNLPDKASPKSSEAFSAVKIHAAKEISAREQAIEALKKEKAALEEKLKNPIAPEVTKELEDLRSFRARLDVEADPKFKEFDKAISQSHEFIYAQLKKSPAVNDDIIKEIKKHGGPEMVKLDKLFEAIKDPVLQRIVESKVADIEMAKFNKEEAIKSAKQNIGQYVAEREKVLRESVTSHNIATQKVLTEMTAKLEWMKEKTPAADANEDIKKSVAAHNSFVKETQKQLEDAKNDDSPEMRAILLTGMAQLFYLQRAHEVLQVVNTGNEKKIAELTAELAKVHKSSVSRLSQSGAPPSGQLPQPKKDVDTRPATEALDDIAKQVQQERAAKAASGQ